MPGKGILCSICKKTRASCGQPDGKISHCGKCKERGMINLTILKCEVCHIVIPIYGIPGGKPTHCKVCKLDTMIDVKTQKCKSCKNKQPTYGVEGTKSAEYCIDCKADTMVDVRSKMCIICNKKQPFFGMKYDISALYCGDCKMEDMIDIKSTKCIICQSKFPVYGVPGGPNTHCKACKNDEHIDVKNKMCIVCKRKQSTYGDPAIKQITHCKDCKPENYVDIKHKMCISEYCDTRPHELCRGYCSWCFQNLYPEDPISKSIHTKTYEKAVAIELLAHDSSYKHDKPIFVGGCDCSIQRRIDFWKLIGNTILAIEVDEHQHRGYDQYDEVIRYDDLYMGFGGKWVFIRFNPTSFRGGDGKINKMPFVQRIPILLKNIREHEQRILNESNTELLEIHKLFFDGYSTH